MIKKKNGKLSKERLFAEMKDIFLVLAGCFVLALADAIFIVPCNIVNGGVDSLGVILNHYLEPWLGMNITDIVIALSQALLWLVGCFALGKKFSLHTLLGSLAFPAFYSLLLRLNLADIVGMTAMYRRNANADSSLSLAVLMLAGIFGGGLSGTGVALAYLGNGSTGGFDVVSFIIAKYSELKQDLSGLILDTTLIIFGIIAFQNWELGLAGVLSAFSCALAVQFVYVYTNSFIIVDIISKEGATVQRFIQDELGHGTTVVQTIGGFSKENRKMIRVVIYRIEMSELKSFIAAVDPKAFVSFTVAQTINGKGFEPFVLSARGRKRILKKYNIPNEEKTF